MSMDILVFSDSHGDVNTMAELTEELRPRQVLHLGDHYSDLEKLKRMFPGIPMLGVRGNCDAPGSPERLQLTVGDVRILMLHGHRQRVKDNMESLYYTALEAKADLVLFGHTHRPMNEREGQVRFLNPGSIGRGYPPSYALLRLNSGPVCAEIRYL